MVRIKGADAPQFIEQRLRDQFRRCVVHSVHDTMPYSPNRSETAMLLYPADEKKRHRICGRTRSA
jgi:hypothetical protein